MRIILACSLLFAACGSSQPQTAVTTPTEQDTAKEMCCCKSFPLTSEDGAPAYEIGNRMECSSKQGTCVDDVQCQGQAEPE